MLFRIEFIVILVLPANGFIHFTVKIVGELSYVHEAFIILHKARKIFDLIYYIHLNLQISCKLMF